MNKESGNLERFVLALTKFLEDEINGSLSIPAVKMRNYRNGRFHALIEVLFLIRAFKEEIGIEGEIVSKMDGFNEAVMNVSLQRREKIIKEKMLDVSLDKCFEEFHQLLCNAAKNQKLQNLKKTSPLGKKNEDTAS